MDVTSILTRVSRRSTYASPTVTEHKKPPLQTAKRIIGVLLLALPPDVGPTAMEAPSHGRCFPHFLSGETTVARREERGDRSRTFTHHVDQNDKRKVLVLSDLKRETISSEDRGHHNGEAPGGRLTNLRGSSSPEPPLLPVPGGQTNPWRTSWAMGPSLVLLLILSALSSPVQGSGNAEVECVMNTVKVLTCTWNHPQHPTENYTFYYWASAAESKAVPCPEYLVVDYTNIGCKVSISEPYETFGVKLNKSGSGPPIGKKFKKHQDYVKMDPPFNLSTEITGNLELMLRWEQSFGTIPSHCVTYRVKHRTLASDSWTEKDASNTLSVLSSFDSCQNYTFHVKTKMSNVCANAFMWSEWSEGVTWARNATVCDEQPPAKPSSKIVNTGITVGLTLLIVVIILAVVGQERIWVILVPQIPNPGKNFEELINGCNVQEWVGVSKEAVEKMNPNYTETLCTVTEDSDCTGPDGKSLMPTAPEN
ncbi:PREDICTED: cytokine receptor common subunit gamma [Nanorana parkeri]|uniref:cytokine receptor common subunit gamma n=1 Tax=Nanorana parkeri TaxID=125878 RepID=UPI0008549F33|nr:PREDICTED: cytokine receptor common subunit gamma [Nanorana parkeri]